MAQNILAGCACGFPRRIIPVAANSDSTTKMVLVKGKVIV